MLISESLCSHFPSDYHGNPIDVKESYEHANSESDIYLFFPLLVAPQKHQAKRYYIYAEDLVQTHAGSVLNISISMT